MSLTKPYLTAAVLAAVGAFSPAALGGTSGSSASSGAQPFEGDVALQVTTDRTSGPESVTIHVKGDQTRYDLPASLSSGHQAVQAIVDTSRHELVLVMPEQKTYAVVDMSRMSPATKRADERNLARAAGHWTAAPTGASQSFAGHDCQDWTARNDQSNARVQACLTPGVRIDFDRLLPASLLPSSWSDRLRRGELPLEATIYSGNGQQTFHEEVTSVTSRALPDTEFSPPPGYRRVELPLSAFGAVLPSFH